MARCRVVSGVGAACAVGLAAVVALSAQAPTPLPGVGAPIVAPDAGDPEAIHTDSSVASAEPTGQRLADGSPHI